MLTNFKRIFGFAVKDFCRNKGISVAAVFILIIAISLVTGLFLFRGITNYLSDELQSRIDITAYFKDGTSEEEILVIKDEIAEMVQVKSVDYISQDQALVSFSDKHSDNSVLTRALEEVGENPFLGSLNIVTNGDPEEYAQVSAVLQNSDFSEVIDKVDFSQKEDTIEKVYSITTNVNIFGLVAGIILIFVAILVVFNTIKLGIENSRDEIATMKIVGADSWFVRGPFIIQGILYGFLAFIVCFLFTGLFTYFLSSKVSLVMPGFSLFSYFVTNWWIFILLQLGFGSAVGVVSALLVVKKYLEE